MARYTGADCRLCRREKMKLFLKGSKCESPKCPIEIRPYPPGEHLLHLRNSFIFSRRQRRQSAPV